MYKNAMNNKWIRQKARFQIGDLVRAERLEEVVPATVFRAGDANLYLLMPLEGPPMFWAFEAHMSPLSPEEKSSLDPPIPSGSKKPILTHF